jgi:hypothetical protein
VKEPEKWQAAADEAKHSQAKKAELGSFKNLLSQAPWNRRALLGMALAAVGLGTFWAVTVAGQSLARDRLLRDGVSVEQATEKAKFAYGIVQTTGGGLGLLAFGPISAWWGRRRTFIALTASVVLLFSSVTMAAEQRAKLSIDLKKQMSSGSTESSSVTLSLPPEAVDALVPYTDDVVRQEYEVDVLPATRTDPACWATTPKCPECGAEEVIQP